MIVKEKHNLKPITQMSKHYKLYKDGKHLVTAGIASLSVIGVLAVSSETTVHADTTNNSTSGTQQTATGGNAVTATTASTTSTNTFNPSSLATPMTNNQVAESKASAAGTITQPVNIDHSQLNNAVDQARQAGLTVNQQPTTTQTVNQGQVDAAKQNIQNDEAKQAQQIQTITRQHQTEVSNVNNFNGSKGDTSQLDAKVKEAQSIPGLTVVHDQDQTTVKKASDTEGIQEAVNNATKSNNDQAQSIQNAINTQKQKYQDYVNKTNENKNLVNSQSGNPNMPSYPDQTHTAGRPGAPDSVRGFTNSGTWQNLSPIDLGNGLVAVGIGNVARAEDLSNGNYRIAAYTKDGATAPDTDHIITNISWGNVAPQLISGSLQPGAGTLSNHYDYGSYSQMWHVTDNTTLIFPGAITTQSGKKLNLRATFFARNQPAGDDITLWNERNAINYGVNGSANAYNNIGAGVYLAKDTKILYSHLTFAELTNIIERDKLNSRRL